MPDVLRIGFIVLGLLLIFFGVILLRRDLGKYSDPNEGLRRAEEARKAKGH